MRLIPSLILVLCSTMPAAAQSAPKKPDRWDKQPDLTATETRTEEVVYKTTPQGELSLHVWSPAEDGENRPCVVFFFGGGWRGGTYRQFARQSDYLASRGIVAISADYRVSGTHGTTPEFCVQDAKSAMRWVRAHASDLGIDPDKVISGGGSAGGHLAAAVALLPGFDDPADDLSISAKPNAMLLFNPALNLGLIDRDILDAEGKRINEAISPTQYLAKDTPPSILFFGTADALAEHGTEYVKKAKEVGAKADLWLGENQAHGFFNDAPWLEVATDRMDRFLVSLGYLKGEPTVRLPESAPELQRAED